MKITEIPTQDAKSIIRQDLINVITQIQEWGDQTIPDFTDAMILLYEVEQFDSILLIEATTLLAQKLSESFQVDNIALPGEILFALRQQAPLTLGQCIDKVYHHLCTQIGGKNE
jgi:hypothetical protein